MTGKLNPARWILQTHRTGNRIKAPTAAAGAGALISMAVLATALGCGAHATAEGGGKGKTSTVSTAPSTLATSVATPAVTATPYGGEGP